MPSKPRCRTKFAILSAGKAPCAPHASGKAPVSWFELTASTSSAGKFAQAGGSVLQTGQVLAWVVVSRTARPAKPGKAGQQCRGNQSVQAGLFQGPGVAAIQRTLGISPEPDKGYGAALPDRAAWNIMCISTPPRLTAHAAGERHAAKLCRKFRPAEAMPRLQRAAHLTGVQQSGGPSSACKAKQHAQPCFARTR